MLRRTQGNVGRRLAILAVARLGCVLRAGGVRVLIRVVVHGMQVRWHARGARRALPPVPALPALLPPLPLGALGARLAHNAGGAGVACPPDIARRTRGARSTGGTRDAAAPSHTLPPSHGGLGPGTRAAQTAILEP